MKPYPFIASLILAVCFIGGIIAGAAIAFQINAISPTAGSLISAAVSVGFGFVLGRFLSNLTWR